MVFHPRDRHKVISCSFPQLSVGNVKLQYVPRFKYLGHMIVSNNADDADIQREVTNLFIRTKPNMLIRKFSK